MKTPTALLIVLLTVAASVASAQSKSFEILEARFAHADNVHSVSVNGFLARTVLWMTGESEAKDVVRNIHDLHLITIPAEAFKNEGVSVEGFKRILEKDSYELIASKRENGQTATLYLNDTEKKNNRYFILVEDDDEVVVIELSGYVDPKAFLRS